MKHKKYLYLLICILLTLIIPLETAASAILQDIQFVVDNADILSDSEHIELNSAAMQLSQKYNVDVLIMTTPSLDGVSIQEYAESLYDKDNSNWTGAYWDSSDTVLFLLAMEEREWYISTYGEGIYIFTDYGMELLGNKVVPYFTDGDYYEGFSVFLQQLPEFFDAYAQGSPIDGFASDYDPGSSAEVVHYEDAKKINYLLSLGIGLIAAGISVIIMRYCMNTSRAQHSATDYMKHGSYHLTRKNDLFLYSNVSKVKRQEPNQRSGGGSSVHRSSGGGSHGGRGGKF